MDLQQLPLRSKMFGIFTHLWVNAHPGLCLDDDEDDDEDDEDKDEDDTLLPLVPS